MAKHRRSALIALQWGFNIGIDDFGVFLLSLLREGIGMTNIARNRIETANEDVFST